MRKKVSSSFWKNSTSGTAYPTPLKESDLLKMADAHMKAWSPEVTACSPRAWKAYLEHKKPKKNSKS
jgi:hypothetical protein